MNHLIIPPPNELAHLVKCFWFFDMKTPDSSHLQVRTFVNDATGITFVRDHAKPRYRATIEGHNTSAKVFDPVQNIQAFGVQFFPGALSRIFGCGAHEFTGHDINLNDVVDWDVSETLINTSGPASQVEVLHTFLTTLLNKNDRHVPWVTECVKQIYLSKGRTTVTDLQKHLGRSERQIERRLLDSVGVSARHLLNVLRFQESVALMRCNPTLSFLDVAYMAGYYDQAHFIREAKRFSGFTPKKLKERLVTIPVNQKGSTRYLIDLVPAVEHCMSEIYNSRQKS